MTKEIKIGNVVIGGGNKIAIQSMTNTDTADAQATIRQIKLLEAAGCEIVRASVNTPQAAKAFKEITDNISIPLVADVHFDHRLAFMAVENGASKLRINPGNISSDAVKTLVGCVKAHNIPVRIGVNGGSLSPQVRARFGETSPEALVASAMENIKIFEDASFNDIAVSVKSSDVRKMVAAYRLLSAKCDYPLHLGVTEAGTIDTAIVKSSIGIGSLLLDNIGDTIRVSITGDPVQEVYAAQNILRALGLLKKGVEIISCPTCARTRIPLEQIVDRVRSETKDIEKPLKAAIMGCVVNGPGEAKEADIGIAGGGTGEKAVVFKKGEKLASGEIENMITLLIEELHKM